MGHQEYVWTSAFSPNGKKLVSGEGKKTLPLWEVATGEELWQFTGPQEEETDDRADSYALACVAIADRAKRRLTIGL
jgi:WD40 repeat protein